MKIHGLSEELLPVLMNGDRSTGLEIVNRLLEEGTDVITIYEGVIKPAMYKVGELWEEGKISVATEHLASAIVETLLGHLYYRIIKNAGTNKMVVVITSVEDEVHQIGAKMVSDMFELHGWTSHFLGANTPMDELLDFISRINPTIIGLSMSINLHTRNLEKTISKIRERIPEMPILVGGQGLIEDGKDLMMKHTGVLYLKDLPALENFLKQSHYEKDRSN